MRISKVEIENYKGIGNLELNLDKKNLVLSTGSFSNYGKTGVEYVFSPCKSDDKVNDLLAKLEIPSEIIEKLVKVHKLLFDEPLKEPRYLY